MQKAMTTALTIITDALTEIGVVGASDTVQPEDATFCLRKLNQVLQRWANMRLMLPALVDVSVPMTGAASYTIGPSGAVVAARPVRVSSARCVDSAGTETDIDVFGQELWDAIVVKNVTGGPVSTVWYEATNTNGTLRVYPKAGSGFTVKLRCLALLEAFTIGETVALPEGYETALTLTLADDIAGAYGRQSTPDLRRRATAAVRTVKRSNAEPLILGIDATLVGQQSFEVERGY